MFKKYQKILRLGTEETDGILNGYCFVQEKIDGANTQIWFDESVAWIKTGSRSQEIKEGFNGFIDYVQKNEPIKKLLQDHPTWHLYGEWLVKHSITYSETAYKKWYMFDIMDDNDKFLTTDEVDMIAKKYGIPHPKLFGIFENPTVEQLQKFVGVSELGKDGEGIVIKNFDFVNKFGDLQYAKIVTQKFKELNGVTFGGNNKHSDTYNEMYVVNKYMTLPRVQKIMNKIQPTIDERLDMKHIPRIMESAYHDMLTEEVWDIQKKSRKIDFGALQRLCYAKAKQIFIDIINDSVSVADRQN